MAYWYTMDDTISVLKEEAVAVHLWRLPNQIIVEYRCLSLGLLNQIIVGYREPFLGPPIP